MTKHPRLSRAGDVAAVRRGVHAGAEVLDDGLDRAAREHEARLGVYVRPALANDAHMIEAGTCKDAAQVQVGGRGFFGCARTPRVHCLACFPRVRLPAALAPGPLAIIQAFDISTLDFNGGL